MATAVLSSANRVVEGSHLLNVAPYPEVADIAPSVEPATITSEWIASFNDAIAGDVTALKSLFSADAYWRDQLCLSWDFRTLHTPKEIVSFLKASTPPRVTAIQVDPSSTLYVPQVSAIDAAGDVKCIQSFLTVETAVGTGRGVLKLILDKDQRWRAYTLLTTLRQLNGHEELIGDHRQVGVAHGGQPGRLNWRERREAEVNYEDGREPAVLILGAGQGGLALGARLKQLGVDTLIIDRHPNIGDAWATRYHQLVLHDPVWYDHMPYIEFPKYWPIFTPKDKLAEWFRSYAAALELNVWTSTTIQNPKWDASQGQWTVEVVTTKDGRSVTRTFHPRHIVQATGHSGEKNVPDLKGMSEFKGDFIGHSSQFRGAKENSQGKKAIIIGCCNSAHDIAQDYYEHGYDVTMIQRSSTCVITSEKGLVISMKGLYEETGPPVDDADLLFMSYPNHVLKRVHQDVNSAINEADAEILNGLTKAGFKLDKGPDDAGLFMKYFHRGGGYYIDVGASQLIADGKIKVKQGEEVAEIKDHSVVFTDGVELPADEIVLATGYRSMRSTARTIFGNELADSVSDVWGFDETGEIRTMWRRSGHPGFWFFGGNLMLARYFSRLTALLIKSQEVGIRKADEF